jgi:hypothetical protein
MPATRSALKTVNDRFESSDRRRRSERGRPSFKLAEAQSLWLRRDNRPRKMINLSAIDIINPPLIALSSYSPF